MGSAASNIFVRLYRHRPQRNSTPKENFVTEALAIVFSMQPRVLHEFFGLLGEPDIPDDLSVRTQVAIEGACFDIVVSNDKDFYFLIESKLDSGFGDTGTESSGQLHRYAEEVRRSSAQRKGLITITVRTPPNPDLRDIRFLTARWNDILELCDAAGRTSERDVADVLTSQFAELLRFLKVDRTIDLHGRLVWRCDLCPFESSAGLAIHSHRSKHCREYAHLIEAENRRRRQNFEGSHSDAIATFLKNSRGLERIEMQHYDAAFPKIVELLESANVPKDLWRYALTFVRYMFSHKAHEVASYQVGTLPGVSSLTPPQYISCTYENILHAIAQSRSGIR